MRNNTRQIRANSGKRIALGVLIIVISLFCFLCDVRALGSVGRAVYSFLVGFFGLADYAYSIVGVIVGIAITFNLRVRMRPSKFLMFFGLFVLGVLALQVYTSSAHIANASYKEYLLACYDGTNTAGGMLYGLLAYLMMKAITPVGALVVIVVAFFTLAFFAFYPFIKKNVTYEVVDTAERERKREEKRLKKAEKEENKKALAREREVQYPATSDEEFNAFYPNRAGGVEDEDRIPDKYSTKGLARDILFNQNTDERSIERYHTMKNPESALSRPGASYSSVRRAQLRSQLGINGTSNGMESYTVGRAEETPREETAPETAPVAPAENNEIPRIDMDELRRTNGGMDSGRTFTSFEALKADQLRRFGESYKEERTPETDSQPAEEEKKEVVKPTKIVAKPEIQGKPEDKASTMAGLQGSVKRAITGEQLPPKPQKVEELEAEGYMHPTSQTEVPAAVERQREETPVRPAQPVEQTYVQPVARQEVAREIPRQNVQPEEDDTPFIPVDTTEASKPDWARILGNAPAKTPETQRVISPTEGKSIENEGKVYQSSFIAQKEMEAVAKARKEAPPLSAVEKSHIEAERASQAQRVRKVSVTPSAKAIEKKIEKLEKDDGKERLTQVTIDQSIYQATPKKPYVAPPLSLLLPPDPDVDQNEDYEEKKRALVDKLAFFDVSAEVTNIQVGPTFSLYTMSVVMPKGRTVSTLTSYEHDIAMAMEQESVRILAPIPGKNAVGIEVPNKHRKMVRISELIQAPKFNQATSPSTCILGKDLYGNDHICDIRDLPHMLVAGATGAGKSCCINSIIVSLLYKASPDEVRLILIDPKRVELSVYEGIPHLMLDEIICDVDKAIRALNWAITEMLRRIEFFKQMGYRNIEDYNADCQTTGNEKMPRIVIIVDELADLMDNGKKAVEDAINRIARLARAVGIHLILATQRPSVDVVSGTIKNNLPSRIAFKVTSGPDSRTILDAGGADKLLGNGDMLFMTPKTSLPTRMQGAFISNPEVKKVVDFLKANNESYFDPNVKDAIFKEQEEKPEAKESKLDRRKQREEYPPELFDALRLGMEESISASYLQRKLGLGWQKAARIGDIMKDLGVLVPDEKDPKKRSRVNMTEEEYEQFVAEHSKHDEDDE